MIPDLLHYWLTGIKVVEYTNASTTQMIDPTTRSWASDLVRKLGLPDRILGTVIQPGTVLGPLRPQIVRQTGLSPIPVVAPATHDTGSAVAAVPARGESWAFISSGTWSLMGTETREPILTEKALAANFTNEGGVAGTTRLLKNIMGMWLLQECRRTWEADGVAYDYEKLMHLADAAPAFASAIDPDDESFLLPARMPDAIADFCRRTGQPVPTTPGSIVRTALESLALRYRWVLGRLEELTGRRMDAIHIVGGGSRNTLLCQWTADACGRPVIAGPIEATAIGNVLVQMIGLGVVGDLSQARGGGSQNRSRCRRSSQRTADAGTSRTGGSSRAPQVGPNKPGDEALRVAVGFCLSKATHGASAKPLVPRCSHCDPIGTFW